MKRLIQIAFHSGCIYFLFLSFACRKTPSNLSTGNKPPLAAGGPNLFVRLPLDSTILDGNSSYDPDGMILSWSWEKISGPAATLRTPQKGGTVVAGLKKGIYKFELKVTDNGGLSARDTVQIRVDTIEYVGNQNLPLICYNNNRPEIAAVCIPAGTLSKSRSGAGIAIAGNKLFVGGGAGTGCANNWCEDWGTSRVDIIDLNDNSIVIAELSKPRYGVTAIAAGNKVFFAGGESGDGARNIIHSDVDMYDLATKTWSLSNLSVARSEVSVATIGTKVFFAGGRLNDAFTSDRVDIYDFQTGYWSTAQLSEDRADIRAVTVNNKIYFGGGWRTTLPNNLYSKRIDVYDNSNGTWSTLDLSQVSGPLSVTSFANKIYWAKDCTVEIFDIPTGNTSFENLSTGGSWIPGENNECVIKNGKIIFYMPYSPNPGRFDIYDPGTGQWTTGFNPSIHFGSSMISTGSQVYLVGCYSCAGTDDIIKLNF